MSKSNYNASVKRLREFLKKEEEQRQSWAKENWSHSGGKLFKIGRVLVPVLSFAGMFLMLIVCLIRFINIPAIGRALANNESGLNETAKEDPIIHFFFILVFIALCLLVYISIRFIIGKFKKTLVLLFGNSLFLSICALLRYSADQGTFPDNSGFDGAPAFTYYEYCLFTMGIFLLLTVYGLILTLIALHDRRLFNQNVEHTMLKIISKEKSNDLLTEDEYSKLIDEYIESKKEKGSQNSNNKRQSKKNKKQ